MARRYYVSNLNSDINPGGTFQVYAESNIQSSTSTQSVALAVGASAFGYVFTRPLHPGAMTSSISNITVNVDLSVTDVNMLANAQIHRINSTGTVQASSAVSSQSSLDVNRSFTISSVDLGTFSATDRLRIDYGFLGSGHGSGDRTVTLVFGDADSIIYIDSFYPLTAQFT